MTVVLTTHKLNPSVNTFFRV